ncbi:Zn-ribbon domain-containing OB-fold protein [Aquabacter spiritensis]|uniref:OB-fold protein n=1 Tax=Aquabacter spiritensis TaxID=933073 RepID=A0A4R3LWK8_9HYPH|nr:Zn-ribbon domain-containing OB-fold protein [Aquabacter spiritensis]TCT04994.1 hypothetical protein EDC64_10525 [Aquabacter spiritensis]
MYLKPRRAPAPDRTPETAAYWDAARDGRLLLRGCRACGQVHHYPRTLCPFCFSADTEWRVASGRGTIYSYSVMHRAAEPYAVAYVRLDEGVTVMTNLVACEADEIRIDGAVHVVFHPSEGGDPIPMFTPLRPPG